MTTGIACVLLTIIEQKKCLIYLCDDLRGLVGEVRAPTEFSTVCVLKPHPQGPVTPFLRGEIREAFDYQLVVGGVIADAFDEPRL